MPLNSVLNVANADHQDMIHVAGLYKCGTSWLLHVLAAHPQVTGWREFDAIRAVHAPRRNKRSLPLVLANYLYPQPSRDAWMKQTEASFVRPGPEIFREMFLGKGWIPLMGNEAQRQAARLTPEDLDALLTQLLDLGGYSVRPNSAAPLNPEHYTQRLGVRSFRRDDLLALMRLVRDTSVREKIPTHFFEALRGQVQPGSRIATKAADQILQISMLKAASPNSRIIAIVRDGRDAAVSAHHFEALMRKREAPWRTDQASYLRRLIGWSMRAAKLAEHARRGDITVLRYEDLHTHFTSICEALFVDLKLDASASVIEAIKNATDFETVTQGRPLGESAEHQIRKGTVGDWQQTLTAPQAVLAWRLAKRSLESFGYTREGTVVECPLVLGKK